MASSDVSAQVQLNSCADCKEPSVCTCSICDNKMCRKHMNIHMDTVHKLSENDSDNKECSLHVRNPLKWFCRSCRLPLCDTCVIDGGHVAHERSELEIFLEFLKKAISNENIELTNCIKPFYQKVLDNTEKQLRELTFVYDKMKKDIEIFRKYLHGEIDIAVNKLRTALEEKEMKDKEDFQNQKEAYSEKMRKLADTTTQNEKLIGSKNPEEVVDFRSSIESFHSNPCQVKLHLPSFPSNMNDPEIQERVLALFGKINYTDESVIPELELDNAQRIEMQLLDQPGVLKVIKTRFSPDSLGHKVYSLSCINSETVLVGGNDYELLEKTLYYKGSRHVQPVEITYKGFYFTLSSDGVIFYSDKGDNSMKRIDNRISNTISTFLEFDSWTPRGLTMTPYNHLLVCLYRSKLSKVVQYAQNGKIVQEIQYSNGQPLYEHPMFICCNRNGDICTADYEKREVIVVNQFGAFLFSYNGSTPTTSVNNFTPCNMATDHLCNIAITDFENHKIHLLDRYGQFLRYINPDAGVSHPKAIANDRDNKMWIGEGKSGNIKVLHYLK